MSCKNYRDYDEFDAELMDWNSDDCEDRKKHCCRCCCCKCCCECNNECDDPDDDWVPPTPRPLPRMGRVDFESRLVCSDGEPLSGMTVNLYRLVDGCAKLVATKLTDRNGRASFTCLPNGIYRIEQPVDRCIFTEPEYFPFNEFRISCEQKRYEIVAINNIKQRKKMCKCICYCDCNCLENHDNDNCNPW